MKMVVSISNSLFLFIFFGTLIELIINLNMVYNIFLILLGNIRVKIQFAMYIVVIVFGSL